MKRVIRNWEIFIKLALSQVSEIQIVSEKIGKFSSSSLNEEQFLFSDLMFKWNKEIRNFVVWKEKFCDQGDSIYKK